MYATCATCPDLAFAVSYLSQLASHPSQVHRAALKRILRYIKGTLDLSITFRCSHKHSNDAGVIHCKDTYCKRSSLNLALELGLGQG
jgi:hypothetical protein